MKARVLMVLGGASLLLAGLGDGLRASDGDSFSELSGLWRGTTKTTALGICKMQGDAESPAQLDLKVDADGHAVAKDPRRKLEGTISSDLSVSFLLKGRSRCPVDGKLENREWTAAYKGQISQVEDRLQLRLEGVEEPCTPCRFKVEYSLRKD